MTSLHFKGKNAVWNHHLSVPYQALQKDNKLSLKGKNEDENLIIEADNLKALKSLLPKYQGQIDCIYIDPPYNTGKEEWVYNDKVNSPLVQEWFGSVVDQEDLTRHDKWLSMMTPRLKLLHELLAEDGVIFISIDDNEAHNLRKVMDEIFAEKNFIADLVWTNKEGGGSSDVSYFKVKHEHILCYGKNKEQVQIKGRLVEDDSGYTHEDEHVKERGRYKLIKLNSFSIQYSKSLDYKIKLPNGETVTPSEKGKRGVWRWSKEKYEWGLKNDFIEFAKNREGRLWPYTKQYFKVDNENKPITRTLPPSALIDKYSSTMATKQLEELFQRGNLFDYSKPYLLIQDLIKLSTGKDAIILDSFAGSGTTAQSVLDLNKDGGNRKFIMVQLPEEIEKDSPAYKAGYKYVHEITRERIKRVIDKEKLKAGFSYMKLGPKIDADSILDGELPTYKEFAKYVYYLATGKTLEKEKTNSIKESEYYVGKTESETIYLIYKKDFEKLKSMAITLDWAEKISKKDKGKKIVYAPACFLDEEQLEIFNISFVSIPYSLFDQQK